MADKKSDNSPIKESDLESLLSVLRDDPVLFERVNEVVQLSRLAAQLLGGVRFNGLPRRTESLPAKKESDSAKKKR